jgi:hypothetical protein
MLGVKGAICRGSRNSDAAELKRSINEFVEPQTSEEFEDCHHAGIVEARHVRPNGVPSVRSPER